MDQNLRAWIGRSTETRDIAAEGPIRRLAALLDHDEPPWAPGALPPLGHWLYFLPEARQSSLGPDGHPTRGGFLPPVALPRRMWAGGRIDFLRRIPFGAEMTRRSTIADIADKSGASGPMTFVAVRHEVSVEGEVAIREERDIVYREAPNAGAPAPTRRSSPPAEDPDFSRTMAPGPVDLFRYSALTFNAHRIHYDRDYATGIEGYPGLVVHGPLIATLLVDTLLRWKPAAPLARSPIAPGRRSSTDGRSACLPRAQRRPPSCGRRRRAGRSRWRRQPRAYYGRSQPDVARLVRSLQACPCHHLRKARCVRPPTATRPSAQTGEAVVARGNEQPDHRRWPEALAVALWLWSDDRSD